MNLNNSGRSVWFGPHPWKTSAPIPAVQLPNELWLQIANYHMEAPIAQRELRQYPVTNETQLQLQSVNRQTREAMLHVIREHLYIQVSFHECEHIHNTCPLENDRQMIPQLQEVFDKPEKHQVFRLRQNGNFIPCLDVNFRCQHLCSDATIHKLAFLPATDEFVLTLIPILHNMTRSRDTAYDEPLIEVIVNIPESPHPSLTQQAWRTTGLLASLTQNVSIGPLEPNSEAITTYGLGRVDEYLVFSRAWTRLEPILELGLTEFEKLLASGVPVHEVGNMAESFLSNYNVWGRVYNPYEAGLDKHMLLSSLRIFGKFYIIICSGLAERFLMGKGNLEDQSHRIFDILDHPRQKYERAWMLDRLYMYVGRWASSILAAGLTPRRKDAPIKENLQLFLFATRIMHAESYFRLALCRAWPFHFSQEQSNPLAAGISFLTHGQPQDDFHSASILVHSNYYRTTAIQEKPFNINPPEVQSMVADIEELLKMTEHLGEWKDEEGYTYITHDIPVIRSPRKLEIPELEHTDGHLEVVDRLAHVPGRFDVPRKVRPNV